MFLNRGVWNCTPPVLSKLFLYLTWSLTIYRIEFCFSSFQHLIHASMNKFVIQFFFSMIEPSFCILYAWFVIVARFMISKPALLMTDDRADQTEQFTCLFLWQKVPNSSNYALQFTLQSKLNIGFTKCGKARVVFQNIFDCQEFTICSSPL